MLGLQFSWSAKRVSPRNALSSRLPMTLSYAVSPDQPEHLVSKLFDPPV